MTGTNWPIGNGVRADWFISSGNYAPSLEVDDVAESDHHDNEHDAAANDANDSAVAEATT